MATQFMDFAKNIDSADELKNAFEHFYRLLQKKYDKPMQVLQENHERELGTVKENLKILEGNKKVLQRQLADNANANQAAYQEKVTSNVEEVKKMTEDFLKVKETAKESIDGIELCVSELKLTAAQFNAQKLAAYGSDVEENNYARFVRESKEIAEEQFQHFGKILEEVQKIGGETEKVLDIVETLLEQYREKLENLKENLNTIEQAQAEFDEHVATRASIAKAEYVTVRKLITDVEMTHDLVTQKELGFLANIGQIAPLAQAICSNLSKLPDFVLKKSLVACIENELLAINSSEISAAFKAIKSEVEN